MSKEDKFQTITNAQLAENLGNVILRRLLADGEALGNLPIGVSAGDCRNNLDFTRGKAEIVG